MVAPRRETSADSAARFLAARQRKHAAQDRQHRPRPPRRARPLEQVLGVSTATMLLATSPPPPRRITVDFAEPTLRAIHDALFDAIHDGDLGGNRMHLTMIAREMVAVALGDPPCDDPPLTDREVSR